MNTTAAPGETPHDQTQALQAFYANRPLMWRNLAWLIVLNMGWALCFTVINPLMTLRMNSPAIGLGEGMIGTIYSINSYLVSFLVMYFSWKSDHTLSRWGRRIPYLWISGPAIIVMLVLFPFAHAKWLVVAIVAVQLFFTDMKNSTISLLPIDLVPKAVLARTMSIQNIVLGVMGFLALRYGMKLSDWSEKAPYLIGGVVLAFTTFSAGFSIKEPPIRKPATESFKPWSALKVGWRDRRMIVLMLGTAMLSSVFIMYNQWIWLYAKNELGLTRTSMGASLAWSSLLGIALAYPAAHLVDRFRPYKLILAFHALQWVLFAALLLTHSAHGLIVVSFLFVISTALSVAPSMMVFKSAAPQDVGSVTSSLALVNNAYAATLILVSGQLIERLGHNYAAGYTLGIAMSAVGCVLLFVYRRLVQPAPPPGSAA